MEKQPHQQYRDELAGKLRDIRNSDEKPEIAKAKAQGYLAAKKETNEYNQAESEYLKDKIFEMGAEERLSKFVEYAKKNNPNLLEKYSRDDILKSLQEVDLVYESGLIFDLGQNFEETIYEETIYGKIWDALDENSDNFDWEAIQEFCKKNFIDINYPLGELPSEQISYSNVALIKECEFSHCSIAMNKYAKSKGVDDEKKRIEKFRKFIECFRKNPKQIEERERLERVKETIEFVPVKVDEENDMRLHHGFKGEQLAPLRIVLELVKSSECRIPESVTKILGRRLSTNSGTIGTWLVYESAYKEEGGNWHISQEILMSPENLESLEYQGFVWAISSKKRKKDESNYR